MGPGSVKSGQSPEFYVDPKTGGVYLEKNEEKDGTVTFKHLCRCIAPRESTEPPAEKPDTGPAHWAPGTR
jgi:hypothetical protein